MSGRTLNCYQFCCVRAVPLPSFLPSPPSGARSRFCLLSLFLFQWEGPWTSGRDLTYERKHWKGEKTIFYEWWLKCILEVLFFLKLNVVVWTIQQFLWKILTVVKGFTFFWGKKRLQMNTVFVRTYQVCISAWFFPLIPSFCSFPFSSIFIQ